MINVHMIIVTNRIPHKTGPPASKNSLKSPTMRKKRIRTIPDKMESGSTDCLRPVSFPRIKEILFKIDMDQN
jgi:hypothetical protein